MEVPALVGLTFHGGHRRAAPGGKLTQAHPSGRAAVGKASPVQGAGHAHQLRHIESPPGPQETSALPAPLPQVRECTQRGEVSCPRPHSRNRTEPEFK